MFKDVKYANLLHWSIPFINGSHKEETKDTKLDSSMYHENLCFVLLKFMVFHQDKKCNYISRNMSL